MPSTTGKMKIQYISCKEAAALKKGTWPSGVIVWMGMSFYGLTKPFFVEPKAKIDAKYYQNKALKAHDKKS